MTWLVMLIIVGFFAWRMMPAKNVRTISTDTLADLLNDKSRQFVDVRTVAEYKARHIKQFQNIPLNELPKKIDTLDQEKEVLVICQSGMRSMQAAKQLHRAGFKQITNVQGGMSAWKS